MLNITKIINIIEEENKPVETQNVKALYELYMALANLKLARYWTRVLECSKGDAFYQNHLDDCIESIEYKKKALLTAEHRTCKHLMNIGCINEFLKRDKTGSFERRNEVIEEFAILCSDAEISLQKNYASKARTLA